MIKDGKMFLDLPEDWKKIIRMLRDNSRYIWYSEEDTCNNPEYKDELTVINQKKIKKKKYKKQ